MATCEYEECLVTTCSGGLCCLALARGHAATAPSREGPSHGPAGAVRPGPCHSRRGGERRKPGGWTRAGAGKERAAHGCVAGLHDGNALSRSAREALLTGRNGRRRRAALCSSWAAARESVQKDQGCGVLAIDQAVCVCVRARARFSSLRGHLPGGTRARQDGA